MHKCIGLSNPTENARTLKVFYLHEADRPSTSCGPWLYKYAFILHIAFWYAALVFQSTMLLYLKATALLL